MTSYRLRNPEGKFDRHRIAQLPHAFRPGTMEFPIIRECLDPCGFPNRKISHFAIRITKHVLPPRHAMITRFESLRGQIERTPGMARIAPRPRLKKMTVVGIPDFRTPETVERVPNCRPTTGTAEKFHFHLLNRELQSARLAFFPICCRYLKPELPPIAPAFLLSNFQLLPRVGRFGKKPVRRDVGAKPRKKHAMPPLRNAVVGGVGEMEKNPVNQTGV